MAFSFGGTSAPSAPSFSFGPSSTPAFGATATPLTKTSSTPLFGTTPSAFGAASTPSLFGASSAAPAFSFNSQPAQSQPSLFGAAPTSSPGFGFGASPMSSPSLFGQQQQQGLVPQSFGAPLGYGGGPQAPDMSAVNELKAIEDAYKPGPMNQRYRFQYFFLNVVDNPAARRKPDNVDELKWREAMQRAGGPDNADNLYPVLAQGFGDLLARKSAQDQAIKEHNERLEALRQMYSQVISRQEAILHQQLRTIRSTQTVLYKKLLKVVRYVDALEGRFNQASGHAVSTNLAEMQKLNDALEALEKELVPTAVGTLQSKVDSLRAGSRLQAGAPLGGSVQSIEKYIDTTSMDRAFIIVSEYAEALSKMQGVLKRNARDTAVLQHAVMGNDMVP